MPCGSSTKVDTPYSPAALDALTHFRTIVNHFDAEQVAAANAAM